MSWTAGPITRHVSRSTTQTPPPPPPQNPTPDLPISSRTRNPTTLLPHLTGRLEATKRTLPRSLVPCRLVPHGAPPKRTSPQHVPLDPREERGASKTEAGALKTLPTATTRILRKPPRASICPQSRICVVELQATKDSPSENPPRTSTRGTRWHASARGNGRAQHP